MIADILSHFEGVKRTGRDRAMMRCPAHADKHASLSYRATDDQRVLLHCFAGCSVEEVLTAAGLTFDDLFPERPPRLEGYRSERRPFLPADAFDALRHEATIVFLIGCDLHKLKTISETDYERLMTATGRIENIRQGAYGSR